MFCSQCGSPIPETAKFCPSCGQALTQAVQTAKELRPPTSTAEPPSVSSTGGAKRESASSFSGEKASIGVKLQGANSSLRVTGSYDEVDLGRVGPQRFLEILQTLLAQPPAQGEDVCAINIIAEGPGGSCNYMIDEGRITNASGNVEYAPEEALKKLLGQKVQPRTKLPPGWNPLRHPECPPTDRDEADPLLVDTQSQPQVSVRVWVGDLAKYVPPACWVGILMASLVMLGSFGPFRPGLFLGALFAIGLLVTFNLLARKAGYQELRLGAHWPTNTLWARVDGKTLLTPDANCIQDFRMVPHTQTTTRGSGLKRQTYRSTVYSIDAVMSNGKSEFVRGLPQMSKGKAEEVLTILQGLLRRL